MHHIRYDISILINKYECSETAKHPGRIYEQAGDIQGGPKKVRHYQIIKKSY